MSKKLKNYPDPRDILNQYGADAMRHYLLLSPVVHAEDLAFSERGVDEIVKKNITRLLNVLSFYELYREKSEVLTEESHNPLDIWILARLAELTREMSSSFDAYELDRAAKPVGLFIDDLSTWYIRRSRDRFKSGDANDCGQAITTTRAVLLELSKLLAPIMPFLAEHIYGRVGGSKESVHLESWPTSKEPDKKVLDTMAEVRHIVSLALEARAKEGIKIRQPLSLLTIRGETHFDLLLALIIRDEVNVKQVEWSTSLADPVELNVTITQELRREGQFRDLVRMIQELRKQEDLLPSDMVILKVETDYNGVDLINEFKEDLKKTCILKDVLFEGVVRENASIDGAPYLNLSLEK